MGKPPTTKDEFKAQWDKLAEDAVNTLDQKEYADLMGDICDEALNYHNEALDEMEADDAEELKASDDADEDSDEDDGA